MNIVWYMHFSPFSTRILHPLGLFICVCVSLSIYLSRVFVHKQTLGHHPWPTTALLHYITDIWSLLLLLLVHSRHKFKFNMKRYYCNFVGLLFTMDQNELKLCVFYGCETSVLFRVLLFILSICHALLRYVLSVVLCPLRPYLLYRHLYSPSVECERIPALLYHLSLHVQNCIR